MGGRGRWLSEFEASLVYRVSSKIVRAIQIKCCLERNGDRKIGRKAGTKEREKERERGGRGREREKKGKGNIESDDNFF